MRNPAGWFIRARISKAFDAVDQAERETVSETPKGESTGDLRMPPPLTASKKAARRLRIRSDRRADRCCAWPASKSYLKRQLASSTTPRTLQVTTDQATQGVEASDALLTIAAGRAGRSAKPSSRWKDVASTGRIRLICEHGADVRSPARDEVEKVTEEPDRRLLVTENSAGWRFLEEQTWLRPGCRG